MSDAARHRILLVDDDRDFIEATTVVLESVAEVEVAYGGHEALVKARASRPDLILLDVIMPDEDGFAVCDKLRADPELGRVPVILLTSLPDSLCLARGQGGAYQTEDYIEKPVMPRELLKRVNRFLMQQ